MGEIASINHDDLTKRLVAGESYKKICCDYVDRVEAFVKFTDPQPPRTETQRETQQ